MSDLHWYVKAELTVIGPDEGPVRCGIEYDATTAEHAKKIQGELGAYFASLNDKKEIAS